MPTRFPVSSDSGLLDVPARPAGLGSLNSLAFVNQQLSVSNGVDDITRINTALTAGAGGIVRGRPRETYRISAPIVVPSNTMLDMTRCTIVFANASVKCNMLQNAAVTPVATATDAATTATSSVVTSPTLAAVAVAGQSLAVVGAGVSAPTSGGGFAPSWLYGTVQSVNVGAHTITLSGNQNGVAATASLSGATAYLFNRDKNILIEGGIWDTGANWNALADRVAGGFNSHLLRLRRIDGLVVRKLAVKQDTFSGGSKGWCFGVAPGDCTDFTIENITGNNSSTAVQGDGPLARGVIRNIRGNTQDDQVAIGCVGFGGNDVEGDISDVLVDGVQANGSWTAFKLFAGQGSNSAYRIMGNVTARSIKGTVQHSAVNIIDYAGQSWVDATVEDVTAVAGSGWPLVFVSAKAAQHITLRNITWPYYAPAATAGVISVAEHVPVLNIANLTIRGSAGSYVGVLLNSTAGRYNEISIDGIHQPDSTISCDLVQVAGGNVDYLSVKKIRQTGAGHAVNVTGGVPIVIHVADGRQDNAASIVYEDVASVSGTTLKLSELATIGVNAVIARRPNAIFLHNLDVSESGGVVSAVGALATPIRMFSKNLRQTAGGNIVIRDGTQLVNLNGPDVGVDAAILTPADQDIVLNNNGLAGWAQGTLIYNAASGLWRQLANQAGIELAYAEITANQTGISTVTDVTGLTITITAPANGRVMLRAWCTAMQQLTGAGVPQLEITDSANVVQALATGGTMAVNAFTGPLTVLARVSGLTPATSYTFKVRALTSANNCTLDATATQRAFIQAIGL